MNRKPDRLSRLLVSILRRERQRQGLTIARLGERAGIPSASLAALEA